MSDKFAVNQRVREIMEALGESKVDPFYKKYFGEDASSERLRTVVIDKYPIKTDFLVEITEKIAQVDGKKVNGHWLLTGEGEMFIKEKIPDEPIRVHLENTIDILRVENLKLLDIVASAIGGGGRSN